MFDSSNFLSIPNPAVLKTRKNIEINILECSTASSKPNGTRFTHEKDGGVGDRRGGERDLDLERLDLFLLEEPLLELGDRDRERRERVEREGVGDLLQISYAEIKCMKHYCHSLEYDVARVTFDNAASEEISLH